MGKLSRCWSLLLMGMLGASFAAGRRVTVAEAAEVGSACSSSNWSLTAAAVTSSTVAPQATVAYEVFVTNPDPARCGPRVVLAQVALAGLSAFAVPAIAAVAPGDSVRFIVSITATSPMEPGLYQVPFLVRGESLSTLASTALPFDLRSPQSCFVDHRRELMITDVSVVDDPLRTSSDSTDPARGGAWTFQRLIEAVAPDASLAPAMVRELFETWTKDRQINGFAVSARPAIESLVLRPWPKRADGALDLARAPLRLLAIVNRLDLRSLARGEAGEGRFVFGVLGPGGSPTPFTLILEYRLPATSEHDIRSWARQWHSLGALPLPSEEYNRRLQAITDQFTRRGADRGAVNGSALRAIRTNEIALGSLWELREFRLSPRTGGLAETPVAMTPDQGFLGSPALSRFINVNAGAIEAGRYDVPRRFEGSAFQAAALVNQFQPWTAPGIESPEARHQFALNTCDGCHGDPETGTGFVHVGPRRAGSPSQLSGFLLGIALTDPITSEVRVLNDLDRRKRDLESLTCGCLDRNSCLGCAEGLRRVH